MELWIRSQDKECIFKVKSIFYSTNDKNEHLIRSIIVNDIPDGIAKLGQYSTKERALEVLDEIQKYLIPNIELLDEKLNGKQVCQIGNILTMVYEMPKE